MNLFTGEITEIYVCEGVTIAMVRVGGAFVRVPLTLLMDAHVGDWILVESGIAIGKVEPERQKENTHVLGDPGKSS
jgi:hydrogenase maturation factor